jgi:hypothetical protein
MSGRVQVRTVSPAESALTPARNGQVQRQCACRRDGISGGACARCADRKPGLADRGGDQPAPSGVHDVLREPGLPLAPAIRATMEPRFGHDFSAVRVHTGEKAADSARSIQALAYTAGHDVVFGSGQYSPATSAGRWLLAHELTHVVQQRGGSSARPPWSIGSRDERHEHEADRVATTVTSARSTPVRIEAAAGGAIQRFSTAEHRQIGDAAYQRALPQNTAASNGPAAPALDPGLYTSLKDFRYRHATGERSTYGQLVTMADDVASFQLMEEQDQERAGKGFRVPVLSRIWDAIGDATHYLDLAARNLDHFHPHNFKAWQGYHWTALRHMKQAYETEAAADKLNAEIVALFREFDRRRDRARKILNDQDRAAAQGSSPQGSTSPGEDQRSADEQSKIVEQDLAVMQRILVAVAQKQQKVAELRQQAKSMATGAMALNGFGDHFLTDAYAGGHIVTPRRDLLEGYATKLFGVIRVGSVLHCASIPSLAWHDLDNKFGVRVKNRAGQVWTTYGDNYLGQKAPTGEPETMNHVVEATAGSIRHLWETAAGRMPTSLLDVLNQLPAPVLDPAVYPAWTPTDWSVQLRWAAGEQVGMSQDAMSASRSSTPTEEVPNPKGEQIGKGPLSARATCWNVMSVFSYDQFVQPMLARIRREYNERFFTGSAGQILPPTAGIKPQPSVVGHTVLGSILGGLLGAGIGLLAGGGVGAAIGGGLGLLAGGLIGGFLGKRRDQPDGARPAQP